MNKSVSDLEVLTLSYALSMDVYSASRNFPKEEKYSLTDQIVRSSRSVAANIAEGWDRRVYENEFKKHLIYSTDSLEETKVWLMFAKDCPYLSKEVYDTMFAKCDTLGAKLYKLYKNWKSF